MRPLLLAVTLLVTLPIAARAQIIDTIRVSAQDAGACATANACASFQVGNAPSVTLQVSGTFTGTLTFEATADGVNWLTVALIKASDGNTATTTTTTGQFTLNNTGFLQVRARATAWTSGTAVVAATRGWASARALTSGIGSSSDTQVLFNDGGAVAGDSDLTWNKTTNRASITGGLTIGTNAASAGAIRMPNNSRIAWRNAANSADFIFSLNASDLFAFDSSILVSTLTSGRVPIISTGGLIADDADLTFSGDTLDVTKARFGTTFETPADTGAQVGIYAPVTASWFIRDTTNNVEFGAYTSGGASAIGTAANNGWSLYSNNTNRWTVQAAGHLVAAADNTYDIGASAATRPRNIYVATALLTGTYIGWDGGSQFRSPSDGIVSVRNSANSVYGSIIARHQPTDHTGDGAITIAPGVAHISKGSAAALTLADPAASDEGTVIIITAETAFAHTVSNAAGSGFNAGGAASDVATFGGAIGDSIVIIAINGKWNVLSLRNVTLG